MSQSVQAMSREQREREAAQLEVSNTLTNLDHAIDRAKKALVVVRKLTGDAVDPNTEHALVDLVETLQAQRKRFVQQVYYGAPNQTRMF